MRSIKVKYYFCGVNIHEKYIKRCIELAKNGLGTTYPNPLVGSVIVYQDRIIGEGWHQKYGGPHAEVHAINAVKDKSLLPKATIYVSLEPCSHHGKTPPCADLIISHKIPNVVIGTADPFPAVDGSGIARMQKAGIEVTVGILAAECRLLNKRFFTFHQKKRPYIILKWAESADGFIAPKHKLQQKPVWITNPYSRQLVHKWRTEEQAILVGTQTAIDDNPALTSRDWAGNNPVRIAIDINGRIPKENHIFDNQAPSLIYSKSEAGGVHRVTAIAAYLYEQQIQSVIIEGGCITLQQFIDEDLWDEARIFRGPLAMHEGTKAPILNQDKAVQQSISDDQLIFLKHD